MLVRSLDGEELKTYLLWDIAAPHLALTYPPALYERSCPCERDARSHARRNPALCWNEGDRRSDEVSLDKVERI